jgi:phage host-nuclease inhibitor protein Gam
MSKSRIKAAPSAIKSRDEMEKVVSEIALLTLSARGTLDQFNAELTQLKAGCAETLKPIEEELGLKMALARDWAQANPAEFGEARSITMSAGTVGFRKGNPTAKLLNKKWSWEKSLAALQSLKLTRYIRTTFEVNKNAIIEDRDTEAAKTFDAFGVKIVQDDGFYIDTELKTADARVKENA